VTSETYTLDGAGAIAEELDLLIRRAQEGEEGAFEEILSRFEGKALALAHHLGASRADAEDIAQEAFLKLFRRIEAYEGGRRFTAYFYRIVVNATRDHLKKMGPAHRPLAEAPEEAEGPAGGHAAEFERRDQIRRALLLLTDREREVVILRDLQGLSTWEVSRILRLNPITVRRHAMQARARLKEILG